MSGDTWRSVISSSFYNCFCLGCDPVQVDRKELYLFSGVHFSDLLTCLSCILGVLWALIASPLPCLEDPAYSHDGGLIHILYDRYRITGKFPVNHLLLVIQMFKTKTVFGFLRITPNLNLSKPLLHIGQLTIRSFFVPYR